MFGGMTGGFEADLVAVDQLNDTWAYDPEANTWADLKPAGPVPVARYASRWPTIPPANGSSCSEV